MSDPDGDLEADEHSDPTYLEIFRDSRIPTLVEIALSVVMIFTFLLVGGSILFLLAIIILEGSRIIITNAPQTIQSDVVPAMAVIVVVLSLYVVDNRPANKNHFLYEKEIIMFFFILSSYHFLWCAFLGAFAIVWGNVLGNLSGAFGAIGGLCSVICAYGNFLHQVEYSD